MDLLFELFVLCVIWENPCGHAKRFSRYAPPADTGDLEQTARNQETQTQTQLLTVTARQKLRLRLRFQGCRLFAQTPLSCAQLHPVLSHTRSVHSADVSPMKICTRCWGVVRTKHCRTLT